jgi:hypothetical protein
MSEDMKDLGVAIALLEKLAEETLPKAMEIKERLDRGEKLDHWDLDFLHKWAERAEQVRPLVAHHPEYQDVYARSVHLYKEIADRALSNEKTSGSESY